MARQKSENRVVPQGRRKSVPTRGVEPSGGGKAVPVKGEDRLLELPFTTAENPRSIRGAEAVRKPDRSGSRAKKAPKVKHKARKSGPARMEEVAGGLEEAFGKVAANKGAPGPDRQTIEEGYQVVVDTDLEQFFDRVNHQRLLARLGQRVDDRRLLELIGKMLKAKVVLPEGVKVSTEEGVPQGGPLSPLLSNIVLDELDWELARRGHRFVRYADDCNIYVRSERAGKRVMASLVDFIGRRPGLKINAAKSAVGRPETRHFLGYRLHYQADGSVEVLLSERREKRLRERIVELTPRSRGWSLSATISGVNGYLKGWLGHFGVCTQGIERVVHNADAHIRRRLRAIVLKHWKRKRTVARRLIGLGVPRKRAWRRVYQGRKSLWALSHDYVVHGGLRNKYFTERGLISLRERLRAIWSLVPAPCQLMLFAEP